jgi:hypothetical protein
LFERGCIYFNNNLESIAVEVAVVLLSEINVDVVLESTIVEVAGSASNFELELCFN